MDRKDKIYALNLFIILSNVVWFHSSVERYKKWKHAPLLFTGTWEAEVERALKLAYLTERDGRCILTAKGKNFLQEHTGLKRK